MNCCREMCIRDSLVDTTELKKIKGLNAILLAGQAGNATGNIVADVVLGKSIPSGKLTDTWAASYEDYPSSKNFSHNNGDTNDEYYSDGIYVGYQMCIRDRRVTLAVGKLMAHVVDDLIRSTEAKWSRISNVQFQNLCAARFHAVCFFYDRSADII